MTKSKEQNLSKYLIPIVFWAITLSMWATVMILPIIQPDLDLKMLTVFLWIWLFCAWVCLITIIERIK